MLDFANKLKEEIESKRDYEKIIIHEVLKNNDTKRLKMTISKAGENIRQSIDVKPLYEQFEGGKDLSLIADKIIEIVEKEDETGKIINNAMGNPEWIFDFEQVRDKLCFKIISQESNKEYLEKHYHVKYLDLGAVVTVVISNDEGNLCSFAVTKEMARNWNVSDEEIFMQTSLNTKKIMQFITEIAFEIIPVITSKSKINGATALMYKEIFKDYCEERGLKEIVIIPSSIHELIPFDGDMDKETITAMIKEVNADTVPPEEVLSDHPYFYNLEENTIKY